MKKSAWLACVVGIAVRSSAVFASENFVTNFVTEVVDGVAYSFVTNMRGSTIIGVRKLADTNSNRLEIPSKLGGKRVRGIADDAFHGSFTGKHEYTLLGPRWVRERTGSIGFETVVLPKGLESIGIMAFYQCADIVSIDIPDTVYEIGDNAFSRCQSLKKIVLPPSIETISPGLFEKSGLLSVDIPKGLVEIGKEAFRGCEYLNSITIPDTVRKIGHRAFEDCVRLEKPTLPMSIKVPKDAFDGCAKYARYVSGEGGVLFETKARGQDSVVITDVKSPLSVEFIEIPGMISGKVVVGVSLRNSSSSRHGLFKGIEELEGVSFPKTIVSLTSSELQDIKQDVKCPKHIKLLGVTNIVDGAFQCFRYLEAIEIPAACRIGAYAFSGCARLKSIVIPDTVTEIGKSAFNSCKSLTNVIFSSSLAVIPYEAFEDCKCLGKIDLPESLQSIDEEAFRGCTELQIESFPVTLKSIGHRAFWGCTKIKRVALAEGFTNFGVHVFQDCTSLSEVNIPSSVKELPFGLFWGCTSLSVVKYEKKLASSKYVGAFVNCPLHEKLKQEIDHERARKGKAEQEKFNREREEAERAEKEREEAQRRRDKELEETLDRISRELQGEMRRVELRGNDGRSNLFLWLLLIVVGGAAGIFVYAKKNGCSYADAIKKIVEKVRAMGSRLPRQVRSTSSDGAMSSNEDNIMAEQDSISFICPHCGQHLEADSSMVNMDLDCPTCGHSINIPVPGSVRQEDGTSHE